MFVAWIVSVNIDSVVLFQTFFTGDQRKTLKIITLYQVTERTAESLALKF